MKKVLPVFALAALLANPTLVLAEDSSISNLQQQVQNSQDQKNALQQQLGDVQKQADALNTQLGTITAQINDTNAQIAKVQNDIATTVQSISDTEDNIRIANIDLQNKKDMLAKSLRVMYSKGDSTYLEFLFSSQDLSDFLYRFEALKDITKANQNMYASVRNTAKALQDKKTFLDQQQKNQEAQQSQLQALSAQQVAQKNQQLAVLAQLAKQQEILSDQINQEDQAINAFNQQIASIIAQREAEKKREEEQQKQRSGNGGNLPGFQKGTGQLRIPLDPGSYVISAGFGWRDNPTNPGHQEFHDGVDFAAPLGTPIYAADGGTVLFAGPASGFGNWIVIDHNNGLYTIYGHMYSNELYVSPGETVQKGQKIAAVGSNGASTGDHLHFGLATGYSNGQFTYTDPMKYF